MVCLREECGQEFTGRKGRKYCSKSCSAKVNNVGVTRNGKASKPCLRCGEKTGGRNKQYCSRYCMLQLRIDNWLSGSMSACGKYALAEWARKYVLEQAGYRCEAIDTRTGERCVEDRRRENGSTVLQVDHIDGNWQNCVRENLRALCPTCHVLTPTWGAGNMGRGRTWKSSYNQYEKVVNGSQ